MNLRHRLVFLIAVIFIFFGCQDSTEAVKPQVVRQKIANESSNDIKKQESAVATVATNSEENKKMKKEDPSSGVETYHYQSTLDPFVPLLKEEKSKTTSAVIAQPKKKRTPQTPLEKIDLSQLTLTAVFRDNKRSMAMVEESAGKGYIVKMGTYVGLDGGKITKISKDRIQITEESQDVMGKPVTIERELKLRQFSGE